MNQRGQTLIELLLLISFSLIALSIIYLIYADYIAYSNLSKEELIARSTIDKIVNSANSLSLSGAGSIQKIFVEIPFDANLIESRIIGKGVVIVLSNKNNVFGSTLVELEGDFKKEGGVLVIGGYLMTLTFNGDKVIISYDDFELNNTSFFIPTKKNSLIQKSFTIKSTSTKPISFQVTPSFSFGGASLALSETNFNLNPSELKTIDFNLGIIEPEEKNLFGEIKVIGTMGEEESTKTVLFSIEVMN